MFSESVENGMIVNAAAYDPEQRDAKPYACPICGDDIGGDDTLYTTISGEIIGCERCIFKVTPRDIY